MKSTKLYKAGLDGKILLILSTTFRWQIFTISENNGNLSWTINAIGSKSSFLQLNWVVCVSVCNTTQSKHYDYFLSIFFFFSRDVGWGKTHINISFLQGNKALITHNEGTTMFNNPLNKDLFPWEGWPWGVGQCVLLSIFIVGCQRPTLAASRPPPRASQVVSIYLYACELHALSQMQLREVSCEFSTTNDGEITNLSR